MKSKINEYLKVFNPFQYKNLIRHRLKTIFNIYFVFVLISIILFLVVLLPKAIYVQHNVDRALSSFDELNVDLDAEANDVIELSQHPKMLVALNNESTDKAHVLITRETASFNFWPLEKEIVLNDYSDFKNRSNALGFLIGVIALLLLPGLLIVFGIWQIICSLLFAGIASLVGFVFVRVFKKDLSLKKLFKVGLLSSVILLLFRAIFVPTLLNTWFPLIVFFVFFLITALLTSKDIGVKEEKSAEKPKSPKTSAKKRNKEIFGSKKQSKDDDFIMLE